MIKYYSSSEERLNILSHGFGALLSCIGLVLLLIKGANQDFVHILSYSVFGMSMIILYTSSTLYHSAKDLTNRAKLRIADHIGIYFLIAGSYTPFCLITLKDSIGLELIIAMWAMALIGTIFKLFFTGRFEKVSTLAYVLMGWSAVIAIKPLMTNLNPNGLFWLMLGGLAYTLGAILYMFKKLPFNHAIFHVFVLIGTFSHFMAVYLYL